MLAKTALTAGAVVVAGVCAFLCIAVDDLSGDGAGGAKKRRASAAPAETPCAGSQMTTRRFVDTTWVSTKGGVVVELGGGKQEIVAPSSDHQRGRRLERRVRARAQGEARVCPH